MSPVLSVAQAGSSMWVDKYKPTSLKNVIGQQGDRSNAKKLMIWLSSWSKNNATGGAKKPKPGEWRRDEFLIISVLGKILMESPIIYISLFWLLTTLFSAYCPSMSVNVIIFVILN